MKRIEVDADALYQVLTAIGGDPYRIRELQATRGLPGGSNPIEILVEEYNAAVDRPEPAELQKALALSEEVRLTHVKTIFDQRDEEEALKQQLTESKRHIRALMCSLSNTIEGGYARITDLGGDCDSIEKMTKDNKALREARAFLAGGAK